MKILSIIIDIIRVATLTSFILFFGLLYPIIKISSEISRKEEEKEGSNND